MKKLILILVLISSLFALTHCNKIVFRDIDCKPFSLSDEYYWNPINIGDTITFINSLEIKKNFVIVDKQISHRTKYKSDMGCGCLDISSMLMTNNQDSIWFKNELRYTESETENKYQDVVFVLNNIQSIFYETHLSILSTYSIDTIIFTNVKRFTFNYSGNNKVKTVYLVKNLGIIRFEMTDGEIWINENLSKYVTITKDTFKYTENTCE